MIFKYFINSFKLIKIDSKICDIDDCLAKKNTVPLCVCVSQSFVSGRREVRDQKINSDKNLLFNGN